MPDRLGPRWLGLITLIFGLLEIPWVIYLIFFQQRTGTAYHTHLIELGLAGATVVLTALCAVGLWRGWRGTASMAVMAATLLATGLGVALLLSQIQVSAVGLLGVVVTILVAYRGLHKGQFTDPWLTGFLVVVAVGTVFHLWNTVNGTEATFDAEHLRLLVVGFDTAETVSLIGLGLALLKGRAKQAIVFGSMGVVLFLVDAWVNILAVPPGPQFTAAIFYAVVGELPSTAMCAAGLWLGMRRWKSDEALVVA